MPIRTGGTAPYAPPATVLQVIQAFRDRGLSSPINEDVLRRASVNESLVPRTLHSLKLLELLDKDGRPMPELEGLRRATTDEFRQRLEAIVRSVYAEVFNFADPAVDDTEKIADAFRAFDPPGQRGRMVTLFMGLCEAAGIVPEGSVQKRGPVFRKKTDAARRAATAGSRRGQTEIPGAIIGGIDPAISGLLQKLPTNGTGWTAEDRQRWLATFTTVLDFAIPTRATVASADEPEDDA